MDRNSALELASSRGFSLWNTVNDGKGNLLYLGTMDDDGIACRIYPESEEFEFVYSVDKTTYLVTSGRCDSFCRDDHFAKFYRQIRKIKRLLTAED